MKKTTIFTTVLLVLILSCTCFALPPDAPTMRYSTTGNNITINWTTPPGATGYILYYAPYPYTGPDSIGQVEMNSQTSFSHNLWDGAAFHVAIQAYNDDGPSSYSNIEYFVIGQQFNDEILAGNTFYNVDYDGYGVDIPSGTASFTFYPDHTGSGGECSFNWEVNEPGILTMDNNCPDGPYTEYVKIVDSVDNGWLLCWRDNDIENLNGCTGDQYFIFAQ